MSEQDINGQTSGGQDNVPASQPATTPGQHSQDQQQPRAQDEQSQGQQPEGQSHEHPEGIIPKAAGLAEQAVETGLAKTSGIVGNTIDKVADAAISALGGHPKDNSDAQGQTGVTDGKRSS